MHVFNADGELQDRPLPGGLIGQVLGDEGIDAQKAARIAVEHVEHSMHPRAVAAEYRPQERRVHVELSNGVLFGFPVDDLQGLGGASDDVLAEVIITASGHGLRWQHLDTDFLLERLMAGIVGTRRWMQEIGRIGGSATSKRKAAAARRNGKQGGRPRSGGDRD